MDSVASTTTNKSCRLLPESSYSIKFPTCTTFSVKNFKNMVDFNPKEKYPCRSSWYSDVKATHCRNKNLLDLPFHLPKCCSDVHNLTRDRSKQKKLQRFGLKRSIRRINFDLKMDKREPPCIPENPITVESITRFPECYILSEFSSEEDEEEGSYDLVVRDSLSECSGCSTLGGGTRNKVLKVIKTGWRELLHRPEAEFCKGAVADEVRKHRLGDDFGLKLRKLL